MLSAEFSRWLYVQPLLQLLRREPWKSLIKNDRIILRAHTRESHALEHKKHIHTCMHACLLTKTTRRSGNWQECCVFVKTCTFFSYQTANNINWLTIFGAPNTTCLFHGWTLRSSKRVFIINTGSVTWNSLSAEAISRPLL